MKHYNLTILTFTDFVYILMMEILKLKYKIAVTCKPHVCGGSYPTKPIIPEYYFTEDFSVN